MTTEQIIWAIVIAVAVLVLIGLIVAAMRKKQTAQRQTQAEELRRKADIEAAGLPDAQARAQQQESEAEHARLEAERAERRAQEAQAEVAQHQAVQEDQIRAADRLDPNVDHKAKDYSPSVSTPAGPAAAPQTSSMGTTTDSTGTTSATGTTDSHISTQSDDPDTILDDTDRNDQDGTTGGTHRA